LAEEIEKELALEVELRPGDYHSFDVLVEEEVIFSKFEEDRFPKAGEIIQLIQAFLDREQTGSG
jgi:predicted Rdx family selenoprotein